MVGVERSWPATSDAAGDRFEVLPTGAALGHLLLLFSDGSQPPFVRLLPALDPEAMIAIAGLVLVHHGVELTLHRAAVVGEDFGGGILDQGLQAGLDFRAHACTPAIRL